jgi:hypothetical protein
VDVWSGNRRLARREIIAGEVQADRHQLAEIDFLLREPADHLEYRLWIDGRASVVLERVELFSTAGLVPPR